TYSIRCSPAMYFTSSGISLFSLAHWAMVSSNFLSETIRILVGWFKSPGTAASALRRASSTAARWWSSWRESTPSTFTITPPTMFAPPGWLTIIVDMANELVTGGGVVVGVVVSAPVVAVVAVVAVAVACPITFRWDTSATQNKSNPARTEKSVDR